MGGRSLYFLCSARIQVETTLNRKLAFAFVSD